jgi:hypothetical protein
MSVYVFYILKTFFICLYSWMQKLWNETISPAVKSAVLKGTGAKDGQQKVANTALYVLMQRAIVPGCPLNGQGTFIKL